ncbi:MAG: hypothetical protein JW846_09840 [Dehalococcoidia bacterium]|nr:hypothetical protein [Dehalococcoidia bacterium]
MYRGRLYRGTSALLLALLLITTTSCGSADDLLNEAGDVLKDVGDVARDVGGVVKDAIDEHSDDDVADSESGGQTVSRPPRPTGTIDTGAEAPLVTGTIGPSGGTVTVDKPDDPLNGLEIRVPVGAFSDSRQFAVSSAPVDGHTFGKYFTPATPLITIENGGDYSNEMMTVRIPVDIPPDHFAMAFYYNEADGTLEGIPFDSIDEHSITIATRHFCKLLVSIVNNTLLDDLLKGDIDSHFRPGIDDWQFTNYGSYIAKTGHCAGQSITAMWYYCEQPDGADLTLHGRYDNNRRQPATPDFWQDDSYGYRLVSVVQDDIDWDNFGVQFQIELRGKDDLAHYKAFAYAIALTGEPQYVGLASSAGGGHAMVVYRVYKNSLYIADPNYPGNTERRIELVKGEFEPYNSGENAAEIAAGHTKNYESIGYRAKTSMVDWAQVSTHWNELKAGTIGNGSFPQYQIDVVTDGNKKEPLFDGYESQHKKIEIEVNAAFPVVWDIYRNGTKIDRDADWKYELDEGNNLIGVAVWGDANNNPQARKWKYVDFQYFNVQYGESECYGWVLDSVTTENYYEMPSNAYFQNLAFQASDTGSFSGYGDFFVYDTDPSGSADDIFAHHTTSGTWTPPPSCIPPDEPVYLDMRCTSTVVFDQNVDWGTLDTYLLITDGTYSTNFGHINHSLDNVTNSQDDSTVAEVYMYEGFDGIGPMAIKVRCGTPAGSVEYVYTYVWHG